MLRYGGAFVKALGACVVNADGDNYARLRNAFPEYFGQYERLAFYLKAKDDAKP
jgi:hypothetical protein